MRWKLTPIKPKIVLAVVAGTVVTGLSSAVLWNGVAHGEWDLPGLQQQVQHVTEVTNNHEARISNLEAQANTPAGQPTPTPQVVTKVITATAPAAAPVVQGASTVAAPSTPEVTPAPTPKTIAKVWRTYCVVLNVTTYQKFKVIVTTYSDKSGETAYENGQLLPASIGCSLEGSW